MSNTDIATRRWRLRGWTAGRKELLHDRTCTGDHALSGALNVVENDPAVRSYTATLLD